MRARRVSIALCLVCACGDDGGAADGGAADGAGLDSGRVDGGTADGGAVDGGAVDGGAVDGGVADGGVTDGGCSPTCSTFAVDSTSSADGATASGAFSFSHACAGDQRALIVGLTVYVGAGGSAMVTGVAYDGVPMTLVTRGRDPGDDDFYVELWKLSSPNVGAHDVVVNVGGEETEMVAGAISFVGAHSDAASLTGSPAVARGRSTTPSVDVSSAPGEIVVDNMGNLAMGDPSVGPVQTERWSILGPNYGSGSTEPGAVAVSMSWSLTGESEWATCAVSVRPSDGS